MCGGTSSVSANAVKGYYDGKLEFAPGLGSSASVSLDRLTLFAKRGGTDACVGGTQINWVALWTRALTDPEVFALYENPWQVYRPASTTRVFLSSSSAPSKTLRTVVRKQIAQPQGAVQVNWSNPITQGLEVAILHNQTNQAVLNLANPNLTFSITNTGSNFVKTPRLIGVGNNFADSNFTFQSQATLGLRNASPTGFTVGSVAVASASNVIAMLAAQDRGNATRVFQFRQNASNLLEFTTFTGSSSQIVSTVWPSRLTGGTVAASVSGTAMSLAVDGVLTNATVTTANNLSNTGERLDIAIRGIANNWVGTISLSALWSRKLTDTELVSWTQNPWQLFAPRIEYTSFPPLKVLAKKFFYIQRKPVTQPQAPRIDRSSRFANGLVFAQVGDQPLDLNFNGVPTVNGTPASIVSPYGRGLNFAGTSSLLYPNSPKYMPTTQVTILSVTRPATGQANNTVGSIFGRAVTASGQAWGLEFFVSNFSTNGVTWNVRNNGGFSYSTSVSFGDNYQYTRPFVISASAGTNQVSKCYTDGVRPASGGQLNTALYAPGSATGLAIGTADGTTSNYNGATYLNLLWNRTFSDTEHLSIGTNPWQIFAPTSLSSIPVLTYRYSRPNADITTQWFSTVATHYGAINEVNPDTSNYLYTYSASKVDSFTMDAIPQPPAGTDIYLDFWASTLGLSTASVQFELLSGATVIKSQTLSLTPPLPSTRTITITASELATVPSWPWTPTLRITSQ
jgi:hypothetical protein